MNIRLIGVAASSQVKRVCTGVFVIAFVVLVASPVQAQMCKSKSTLTATERQGFKALYGLLGGMATASEAGKFFSPDVLNLYESNHRSGVANFAVSFLPNGGPPTNDLCAGAEVIPAAGPFPYLTTIVNVTDATTTGDPPTPSCQPSVSRSVWYTFTPSESREYTVSSCVSEAAGSTLPDSVIAVYTSSGSCAGPFTQLAGVCDDDTCTVGAQQAVVNTRLEAGTPYYVVVWKFGSSAPTLGSDSVQLRISLTERNEGPGIHYSDSSVFLKNDPVGGNADFSFTYGASSVSNYQALSGDWNGDGIDTIGLYNPVTSAVFLAGANASGSSGTIQFQYGAPDQGYIAIAGDWDGDGRDTIGLYDPTTGIFFLRNTNTPGSADITFQFGAAGAGYIPIAGDYDGDGDDSVGLFHPSGGFFFLRNSNSAGSADITFGFGPGTAEYVPVVGDWNGDGVDTIGVVAITGASNGTWFLRNSNSSGSADIPPFTFAVGGGHPIAGDWN